MKNVLKELEALKAKHKKPGRGKGPRVRANFPNLKVESQTSLSNTIVAGGHKRDLITEHKWKKGSTETKETIQEINRKKSRIRLGTSKGAYQYFDDSEGRDNLTIHKKGG